MIAPSPFAYGVEVGPPMRYQHDTEISPPMPPACPRSAETTTNRQQKMLRQKQLALKRQRELRARSCGIVAQSDPPDSAAAEVQKKAAGWTKFVNDLERPQKRKSNTAEPALLSPPAVANVANTGTETALSSDCPSSFDGVPVPSSERPGSIDSAPVTAVATLADDLQVGDIENDSGIFPLESAPRISLVACRSKESLMPNQSPRPTKQQQGWDLQMQGDAMQAVANDNGLNNAGKRVSKIWKPWQNRGNSRHAVIAEPGEEDVTQVANFGDTAWSFNGRGSPIDGRVTTPWPPEVEKSTVDEVIPMPLPGCLFEED